MPGRKLNQAFKIMTPDGQGHDSWIMLRRPDERLKDRMAQSEALTEEGVVMDASGDFFGGEYTPAELAREAVVSIARLLTDWNWVDDNGSPLPDPDPSDPEATADMLIECLMGAEIDYLLLKVKEFNNPGNSKKSKHLSKR
ncbi:MAG: hypothetical protein L0219_07380 [Phycisphaerales bacterium]|nr:hypothetical protein [Phycisphaerales bacterium]